MKVKINRACDLSSISVLPPQTRRTSGLASGPSEPSVFGRSQASQFRSQAQSQQSFSSQHGMFSQLSQSSLDETFINDQKLNSEERENSTKKLACLPPINYTREESVMPIARSSSNQMTKWNSAIPEHRCQIGDELEHRIGMIETSISRIGMILDSVQSDIIQVNKGTKEVTLELESMRQKLIVQDNSLQQMNKGQEDINASLDGGLKSISDQLSEITHRESLQEISTLLSALPEKIEGFIVDIKKDICRSFTKEMQTMASSLRIQHQKHLAPPILPPKANTIPQEKLLPARNIPAVHPKVPQAPIIPKIEMGSWNCVKREKTAAPTDRDSNKGNRQKIIPPAELGREPRVILDSDEDVDDGFSCLLVKETGIGNYSVEEAKEETERILRKARRRKRKHCNTIIIN